MGTLQAGRKEQQWYDYSAALDIQYAKERRREVGYEAGKYRKAGREYIESKRAKYAAGGVTERGTPSVALEETAEKVEMDALAMERAGDISEQYEMGYAKLKKMRGRSARRASYWEAGSTLLGGGSQIYSTWFS